MAQSLRARRHSVHDLGLAGKSDETILESARVAGRVVVTHDRDFGALAVAAGRPLFGILFLRPGHILPSFTIESLETVFDHAPAVDPPFIVVAERAGTNVKIRVRQL